MNEFWDNIGVGPYLPLLQALSVAITIYFIARIGWYLTETRWLESKVDALSHKKISKNTSSKDWERVLQHASKGSENDLRFALIEADSMLNDALRVAGLPGKDLGERLMKVRKSMLPNLQEIWDAHKFRNRLAHETGLRVDQATAKVYMKTYEEAFRSLGLID